MSRGTIYLSNREMAELGVFDQHEHVVFDDYDWYYSPTDDEHAHHTRAFHGWFILGYRKIHKPERRFG